MKAPVGDCGKDSELDQEPHGIVGGLHEDPTYQRRELLFALGKRLPGPLAT